MARHRTTWEDDGMAGVLCDGHDAATILVVGEPPEKCPRCGALLQLNWNVYISEVLAEPPARGETE